MDVEKLFVSINAKDFSGLSNWWAQLLERPCDREPMPSCHEWDIADQVLFQVLDNAKGSGSTTISLLVPDLDKHVMRLRAGGIEIPDPTPVEGFATLRFCQFADPEGNVVGLLEGA